jgi:hypothetical protein
MPIFVAALLGGLINIAGSLVGRVLIALGVGFITYSGFSGTIDFVKAQAINSLQGLPAELIGIIAYMGVGQCISIISSAIVVKMTIAGLTGGTMRRMVFK